MDEYREGRAHVRPPPTAPIHPVPLATTSVTNRRLNRSCGSINARDPPDTKRGSRLSC
jgi:hypothetical protein